jgi:hypothetical protein
LAVVIPAKNESGRIGATVRSASGIPGVDIVLVVDDGSTDATGKRAREAGAVVVRHPHNRGKAAAMETGAAIIAMRDIEGQRPRMLLFLDADLGDTAVNSYPLVPPVEREDCDFTVAVLPRPSTNPGWGMVMRLARAGIARATGYTPRAPLSGQRCLTREAFDAATPLARGWGVETAMTIDLLRQGFSMEEVDCDLKHRPSGKTLRGALHRGAQYRDVLLALTARGIKIAGQSTRTMLKRTMPPPRDA